MDAFDLYSDVFFSSVQFTELLMQLRPCVDSTKLGIQKPSFCAPQAVCP